MLFVCLSYRPISNIENDDNRGWQEALQTIDRMTNLDKNFDFDDIEISYIWNEESIDDDDDYNADLNILRALSRWILIFWYWQDARKSEARIFAGLKRWILMIDNCQQHNNFSIKLLSWTNDRKEDLVHETWWWFGSIDTIDCNPWWSYIWGDKICWMQVLRQNIHSHS